MEVNPTDAKIVELMLQRGLLSDDQLRIGQTEQAKGGGSLQQALVSLGFISSAMLRDLKGEVSGTGSVDLTSVLPDLAALATLDRATALRHRCIPLSLSPDVLVVAMADVDDLIALDRLRAAVTPGIEVIAMLADGDEIQECVDRFYGFELSIDGILGEIESGAAEIVADPSGGYGHPVVRLVDAVLSDAVKHAASDVHFEPEEGFLRIRYRIDGVLHQIRSFHSNCQAALTVRIKVMAGLDIADSRAPQDGRMSLSMAGRQIDLRVSTLPTTFGENIVLRILDRQRGIVPLEKLGLSPSVEHAINLMIARPEGLILVTGPTGSGKTTTLYSLLSRISSEQINIMTMEDPVEYPMPLLRQASLNEQAGLDFSSGIRAILRQDPDIILIGEIRDEDTAAMAYRAAMTGHQVYSTLHANSSIGALARLKDIGVDATLVAGNTIGIVSQRLVRKLCEHCKCQVPADQVAGFLGNADQIFQATGCDQCRHTGYSGRLVLTEVLRMTPAMDELIADSASQRDILACARESGYTTLADDAVRRVNDGSTSFAEVTRVIDFTNRIQSMD